MSVTPAAVGSDSRTYKIAASFARAGYLSTVVEGQRSDLRESPPFGVHSIRASNDERGGRISKITRVVRRDVIDVAKATPPADLYYLHSHQPFPGVAWRRWRAHAPLVYDAHDFYDELIQPGVAAAAKRFLQRKVIRSAVAFVTVSEGVADLYEQAYHRRPVVIRNAHDARIDSAVEVGVRRRIQADRDARIFVVVGDSKPHMATELVIDALRVLGPNVHVAFLGRGHRARLAPHVPADLQGRVHLLDAVAPTEVVPFISSADAAILPYVAHAPNTRYSLQNGFFQSIAAGLPLVVPHDLPELCAVAGVAGIPADFTDLGSITRGTREVLDDGEAAGMARTAVTKLQGELTWEREEAKLLDLVATALEPLRT